MDPRGHLDQVLAALSKAITIDRWTPARATLLVGSSEIQLVAVAVQGLYFCDFYRNDVPSGKLRTTSAEHVRVCAEAWLTRQARLSDVQEACAEFVPLPAGLALEQGTLLDVCWSAMERALPEIRDVALAARSEPVLHALFPSFSSTRLRLTSAFGGAESSVLMSVRPGRSNDFEVMTKDGTIVGAGGVRWAVATMVGLAEAERPAPTLHKGKAVR
jgi:hypothetical protein